MNRWWASAGWPASAGLAAAILAYAGGLVSQTALDHVGIAAIGWAVFRFSAPRRPGVAGAAGLAIALGAGLAAVRLGLSELRYMPYLLIAPANFFAAWLFASGLRPGREPILLRLVRLMGISPADDPRFRRFIAGQCLIWAVLSLSTACVALAALVFVAAQPWLAQLLASLFAVQALWFVLSHHYASFRYGRPEGWWTTARAIVRPEIWARLHAS